MKGIEIDIEKNMKLKSPVLVEGLPGLGWAGRLAAEHLVKELNAEKFADIYSPDFPPQVMINPDSTIRMVKNEVYGWKAGRKSKNDLIILIGDHQGISFQSHYALAGNVLDLAEQYGTKLLYTLGGYGVGRMPKKPRVFGAVTDTKLIKDFKKHGVVFDRAGGTIVGAAGLLLGLGQLRGMQGVCLMGETHGNYIDPKAARKILEVVCKSLGLRVKLDELDSKAKEVEGMVARFEKMQKSQPAQFGMPKDESASYIR